MVIAVVDDDLTIVNSGVWVAGMVTVEGGVGGVGGPDGGVPIMVAESLAEPLSRSACVTV